MLYPFTVTETVEEKHGGIHSLLREGEYVLEVNYLHLSRRICLSRLLAIELVLFFNFNEILVAVSR